MAFTTSFSSLFLIVCGISLFVQYALAVSSTSPLIEATGTSELDLEDERAECFQKCYTEYGNFANCPFDKGMVAACWCSEKDWVEREEDCVWDVCGVDAYNDYANVLKRICQTVAIPSSSPPVTTSLTSQINSSQMTAPSTRTSYSHSSQKATTSTNTDIRVEASSTIESSPSTTGQNSAEESGKPNTGIAVGSNSGLVAGILVCVAYLVRLIL